jgi:hypothetical protein
MRNSGWIVLQWWLSGGVNGGLEGLPDGVCWWYVPTLQTSTQRLGIAFRLFLARGCICGLCHGIPSREARWLVTTQWLSTLSMRSFLSSRFNLKP